MNKKRFLPDKIGARTLEIVEAIKASEEGMTSQAIADKFKIAQNTVAQHLHIARVFGHVLVTRSGGPSPIWYTEAHAEVVRMIERKVADRTHQRQLANQRAYKARKAEERRLGKLQEYEFERDSMPIRRSWVDAAKAEPLRPKGPVSVFDLGAL